MKTLLGLVPVLALSACVVGPNYQRPASPTAAAGGFVEAGTTRAADATPLAGHWWRLYEDPVLDRLVGDALAHNTDIRTAAANLARARAVLSEQRGARLPTTEPSASYTRSRTNAAAEPDRPGASRSTFSRSVSTPPMRSTCSAG